MARGREGERDRRRWGREKMMTEGEGGRERETNGDGGREGERREKGGWREE